jgi:uncharacterized SAM-binding protein YcdF (DUF218 family)
MVSVRSAIKIVSILLALILLLGVVVFFGLGYYLSPQDPLAKSDAIVAISGGDTQARTDMAVTLYKEGWAPRIIFSGAAADPSSPSNADVMRNLAVKAGVSPNAILVDERSVDTSQNAADVKAILQKDGDESIILVTSPYHQRRASITFADELGSRVKIINHSAIDPSWRRSAWWDGPYNVMLTLQELQKTVYVLLFGPPQ